MGPNHSLCGLLLQLPPVTFREGPKIRPLKKSYSMFGVAAHGAQRLLSARPAGLDKGGVLTPNDGLMLPNVNTPLDFHSRVPVIDGKMVKNRRRIGKISADI